MDAVRTAVAGIAGVFLIATVFIGWIMMVVLPFLSGDTPNVDFGTLIAFTVGSLIVWRVAEGGQPRVLNENPDSSTGHTANGTTNNPNARGSILPGEWASALTRKGVGETDIQSILSRAYFQSGFRPTQPEKKDVFRAFTLTPLSTIKTVIVAQDPYAASGHADGLAFSTRASGRVPYSLARIFENLESDAGLNFRRPDSCDLSPWARQGVLLLNSSLTVVENDPGSHRELWRSFTRRVLEILNEKTDPVVFLLWGDAANELADSIPINERKHLVIRSTHPRLQSASRYPRFADTRPFSEANNFLRRHGRGDVNWQL
ncbi:uracil-DNA glycosylase [Arthrobacter citreus]|uniref:uracil-DNA glycosylase n=1 Tax=Arthrobacter citreus TaxID=1670 RepID=UPI00380DF8A2